MSTLTERLSNARIGQPQEIIKLEERNYSQAAANALAERAKHEVLIVSRVLDPLVFSTPEFIELLTPFVRSKRATIRILVNDTYRLVKHSHRLGEFAVALSSKVSIRKIGIRQNDYNEAWMLADQVALLHLPQADKYQGTLDFYSPRKGKELIAVFDDMWDHADLIPDLRILNV